MAQKEETSLTQWSYRERLETVIGMVNWLTHEATFEQHGPPNVAIHARNMCRTFHQIAQVVALRVDMQEDYAKAVVDTDEEWKKFSNRAGVPTGLWRSWTDIDPMPATWSKPRISFGLDITDEGIKPEAYDILQILLEAGTDIKRFRECRVCQRLFWAARLDKKGGPFGCSPGCNNALYQRAFRDQK